MSEQAKFMADLEDIERVAKAATPGIWLPSHENDHDNPFWIVESADGWVCTLKDWFGATENQEADAKYIAAMSPDVALALVAALRAAWAENREYRRYSMVGKIAIGTGFAPPGARWLEDAEWTDEQYAEAQAMLDDHPEWLEGDAPDSANASADAPGPGGA